MRPGWKNAKHADQWANTLATYAYPKLGNKPVNAIETNDVQEVLAPIWKDKLETATRVRGRIEAVLSAAKARGLRSGENPALWRGTLDKLLPAISQRRRVHHAALPWQEAPAFMAGLRERQSMSAFALHFIETLQGQLRHDDRAPESLDGKICCPCFQSRSLSPTTGSVGCAWPRSRSRARRWPGQRCAPACRSGRSTGFP